MIDVVVAYDKIAHGFTPHEWVRDRVRAALASRPTTNPMSTDVKLVDKPALTVEDVDKAGDDAIRDLLNHTEPFKNMGEVLAIMKHHFTTRIKAALTEGES